jgi:hypothetical protein
MKAALCSLKKVVKRRRFVEGGGGRDTYYKVENLFGARGIIHFPDLEGMKGEGKGLA